MISLTALSWLLMLWCDISNNNELVSTMYTIILSWWFCLLVLPGPLVLVIMIPGTACCLLFLRFS